MKFSLKNKKRIIAVLIAVICMGLALSFLIRVNFGTDPCSTMNLGIASKLNISFGTWQVIYNTVLFVLVFIFDRSQIGWGTLANMLLVGYATDFFTWLFNGFFPSQPLTNLAVRILILIPSLILLIISVAVYLAVELGSAPYDAIVFVIASKVKKVPFRFIRMAWDIIASIIGYMFGSTVGIVTVVIAFALGPVITFVRERIDRFL